MREKDLKMKLNRHIDRRRFLKACGALGVGAIAGGVVQGKWDIVGLARGLKKVSQTRMAMGTFVTVTAVHESRDLAQEAIGRAYETMDALIPIFNRHDSASALSVLNRDGAISDPPPELGAVLRWSLEILNYTHGCFNVTVKPLLDLYDATVGHDGTYPSDEQIAAACEAIDGQGYDINNNGIELWHPETGITLDGIAKGYIVDMMSASLAENGVANHLVNAGGDIRTSGTSQEGDPWTIAVEDPSKSRRYPAVLRMTDGAVATSGNYEIYYDEEKVFHHIVDPSSGRSPVHNVSATVSARSVMVADALSTAVFMLPHYHGSLLLDSLRPLYDARGLVMSADDHMIWDLGLRFERA
jgi:thiamine biosynthesis lipoprotein